MSVHIKIKSWLSRGGLSWLRRRLLWLALGPWTYSYMISTLAIDPRIKTARMVDVVVRKDGVERRFEADWIKHVARFCWRDIERKRARGERERAEWAASNPDWRFGGLPSPGKRADESEPAR